MRTAAVICDAFGTVIQIPSSSHPYRQLIREGRRQGRRPQSDDARTLMTKSLSLEAAASHFEIKISSHRLRTLQDALEDDLGRAQVFPDAVDAIGMLNRAGILTAVCSNLAMPYGRIVRELFPALHAYGLSYEVGAMKPDPFIYQRTCTLMGLDAAQYFGDKGRVLMIGDSQCCDVQGPQETGILGFLLARGTPFGFSNLVDFAELVLASHLEQL